jgi:hypothetical protein
MVDHSGLSEVGLVEPLERVVTAISDIFNENEERVPIDGAKLLA